MGVDHPGLPMSIQELMREVRRVAKATIQNSAIGRAGLRIYQGGRLTINDGGGITITDSGYIQIDGDITGEGDFDWSGTFKARGPWELIGLGKVTAETTDWQGNINLSGDVAVVAGGEITAGLVRIDPTTGGGSVWFGAHRIFGGATSMQINAFGHQIVLNNGSASIISGSNSVSVSSSGITLSGLPEADSLATLQWVAREPSGRLVRVPQGMGGPMGGDFDWPFSLSIVTSEFGMRVHPVTGIETLHAGIDFGAPAGVNIPAASSGTVIAAGFDSGRGNYVVLSHPGNVETHYFHMQSTPTVSASQTVVKGQTLGQVGNTGLSDGYHLHFEVHVNGVAIDPRTFAALD